MASAERQTHAGHAVRPLVPVLIVLLLAEFAALLVVTMFGYAGEIGTYLRRADDYYAAAHESLEADTAWIVRPGDSIAEP